MGLNFCRTFYFLHFVNFRASRFKFVVDSAQPSSSPMALVIFLGRSIDFVNDEKGSCGIEWFPCNHNTIDEI